MRIIALALAALLLAACTAISETGESPPVSGAVSGVDAAGEPAVSGPGQEAAGELYTMHGMDEEQQRYYDTYIVPLLFNGMLNLSWSPEDTRYLSTGPEGLSAAPNLLFAFEDLAGHERMAALWESYGSQIPAAEVEAVLTRHFPLTPEQVRTLLPQSYNAAAGTYDYEGGRGGGPMDVAVTGVEEDGAYVRVSYTVYFDYREDADAFGGTYSGVLTLEADGERYRYRSVVVDEEPLHKRDVALRRDYPAD